MVIPSSLLRPSAVCYVTVTAMCLQLCAHPTPFVAGAVRLRADFAQGLKCSELVQTPRCILCACHLWAVIGVELRLPR